ncbi:MAG: glycine--tRNA ligase subunit beta [endosymbiont of Galathealinum brachiosum]|uniref:Glycine--tRNA ligase beta subunit n=1 Tax=endosymbiont of Galathealinum brachiosum TaxID=2200906 RepID=A0A370DD64_9GAMM|nr:MAG: glycine--tRNA ligase subunit beta [endosymbiont of Galathealinum brachiosum]
MSSRDLLIEIGTEELPPKALNKLSDAFASGIESGLKEAGVNFEKIKTYASARRLAVLIDSVEESQADRNVEKLGPAVKAAYDKDGNPTKAAMGFARGCGVEVADLATTDTDKGERLVFRIEEIGKPTVEIVPDIVSQSLAKLPIPKRMRWGDSNAEFVRPVHWVVLLFGKDVIKTEILEIKSGRESRGHRFHHPEIINLQTPDEYVSRLKSPGYVMVDRDERLKYVKEQAEAAAKKLGGEALIDENLLQEVSGLVEWPVAVSGDFDKEFLEVPAESLISSMQDHQKYFPVIDKKGDLLPHFITISNIESKDEKKVKEGNERVIRPRLGDAKFFWEQDNKKKLEDHIESLNKVVFQNKLGSVGDKSRRVASIAEAIAEDLSENTDFAKRAGLLSKCDLMTEMVCEFSDLQGIMGRYYAINDGEPAEVADALDEQYMPRFAGDKLPAGKTGQIVSLADKLDTLLGIFAIGQKPTGEKDPFALRRAALGSLRILIECKLDLDLKVLLGYATKAYGEKVEGEKAIDEVINFMLDRLKVYYTSQNITVDVYDAVIALKPTRPMDFDKRMHAVNEFRELEEADSLAAANKRIGNILKKIEGTLPNTIEQNLLQETAEKNLNDQLQKMSAKVTPKLDSGDYSDALKQLASMRDPIDAFFDQVMVMADDDALKNNRIALLNQLHSMFIKAADLSRLQS